MKIYFLMVFLLSIANNTIYAQQLSVSDSFMINQIVNDINSGSFRMSNNCNDIPKFIINGIKDRNKGVFKITDNKKKFVSADIHSERKNITRFLLYVAKNSRYVVIGYKFGGFVTNTHILLIQYKEKRVLSLFNFIVSAHDNIEMVPNLLGSPNFSWKNSENF